MSRGRGLPSLPHGVGVNPATDWKTKFVPTLIALYSIQPDIWNFEPERMCPVLQVIWNVVFPGKTYVVEEDSNDPVFHLVRILRSNSR